MSAFSSWMVLLLYHINITNHDDVSRPSCCNATAGPRCIGARVSVIVAVAEEIDCVRFIWCTRSIMVVMGHKPGTSLEQH